MKANKAIIASIAIAGGISAAGQEKKPNIIVILCDDAGYADIGCYGACGYSTPHIDSLASQGLRFTNFYDPMPISSPSRAGLMTGCYPPRVGIDRVLGTRSKTGLPEEVITMPQVLKKGGYTTLAVGKWHLGHMDGALPTDHGFDEFFGVPYSNDMHPLPLMHDKKKIQEITDQSILTTAYTEKCVDYIGKAPSDRPFFIYMAHTMPHIPLAVSQKFKGQSGKGLYGDVMMELDWSVGQIVQALRDREIEENTLLVVTSDNGPWLIYGNHAGSAGPFRSGKFSRFEGGNHQFCVMRWNGHIKEGSVTDEICTLMDFFPTFAELAGVSPDGPLKLDGHSILPTVLGRKGQKHHEFIFYLLRNHALGVRNGRWKLMLEQNGKTITEPGRDGNRGVEVKTVFKEALYDLEKDPGETTDLSGRHPLIVRKLKKAISDFDADLAANSIPAADYSPR